MFVRSPSLILDEPEVGSISWPLAQEDEAPPPIDSRPSSATCWRSHEKLDDVLHGALSRAYATPMQQVFPYVVTEQYIAQRNALFSRGGLTPEGSFGLPRIGADLYLALARDLGDGLRILFPSDVAREDLDWKQCLDQAQANLLEKVGTRELPLSVHDLPRRRSVGAAPWRETAGAEKGPSESVLVIGESWLAASCLAAPALPAGAATRLDTKHVMAVLPHRDRLFVFGDRGETANRDIAEAIWAIEADAPQPLPRTLFRLEPAGPRVVS